MTDGNGNQTQYAYDARKRQTQVTYPDGTHRANGYDGPGNLASVTDQAGNVVQYSYDAANQLVNVVQTASPNPQNTTIYGYDANGNPIVLEDANTHTTTNAFDLLNELTTKTLPDQTLKESRTYDNNGNLSTLTHFNGVTTTYTYDQLNRLLARSTPGEAAVSFTYTPTGKRQTMADASGTTNYSYDSMDRLSSKATPEGTLNYGYDAAGNLASMQSADGAVNVSYAWNSLNLLQQATDSRLGTTTYTYDNANNVGSVSYPNGVNTSFTYDLLNRVATASSQVSSYTYGRGPTGNLTSVLELDGRNVTWNYDGIYRLTNESIAGDASRNGSVSYGLDPVGNRLNDASSLTGIPSGSWGYNSDDEVSSESYDQNGNVTATGGKTFAYDSENDLMSMGSTVALLYDGDGNRVGKSVNGVVTRYLIDDLNPTGYSQVVEELSGAGAVERTYTYGLQRISEYQPISNVWTASFYGYDGGGNVRQLTNTAGAVTDTYEYDAFGNALATSGNTPNNMLYRGEEWDPDLSLVYLRARYMNPLTGRFVSQDPENGIATDPETLHKYLFVGGDPVNKIDPSGREALAEYGLTLNLVSTKSNKELTAIADRINCIFNTTAETLLLSIPPPGYTLETLLPNLKTCSAKATYCKDAPPLPSNSPKCDEYGNQGYLGDSLKCFCKCAGDSDWSQKVRACLACEHENGTEITVAHFKCYQAAGWTSAPWGTIWECWRQCFNGSGVPQPILPPRIPFPRRLFPQGDETGAQ
jgi:RHS repeat-associated protein